MFYDYKVIKGNGEELDLASLKGKVVMVSTPRLDVDLPLNMSQLKTCIKNIMKRA